MKKLFMLSPLIILVLSACGPNATAQPTQNVGAIQTAAVQTVQAQPKPLETAIPVPATITPIAATSTALVPATATVKAETVVACNAAQFIRDVTVPDGTVFKPEEFFTKTWELKNVGTCTWSGNYLVVADSGDGMTQVPQQLLSAVANKGTVAPGETVDISIPMQASNMDGAYKTYWRLQNDAGNVIPISNGISGKFFSVEIKVSTGDSSPDITNVSTRIEQQQGSGAVCAANTTYFVYVDITASRATTAAYRIDLTDESGQVADGIFASFASPEVSDSLIFNAADTQRVSLQVLGPYVYPDKITVRVYVNGKAYPETMVSCQ